MIWLSLDTPPLHTNAYIQQHTNINLQDWSWTGFVLKGIRREGEIFPEAALVVSWSSLEDAPITFSYSFKVCTSHIAHNVPLSHLRSKGKASAYILFCIGSGMLTRYTHCGQCNIKNIALTTLRISRYSIPKSPKHQIPLMQPLTACLFI